MKKIAIITGASSGMGRKVALTFQENINVDEAWLIALGKEELQSLENELKIPIKIFDADLTKADTFERIDKLLNKEKPDIKLLVNASGFGIFDKTTDISEENILGMIRLNCEALTRLTTMSLPFMKKGAKIVNFASVAAFQPVPYINVYAATKAYVLSFSRALNMELKKDGIHVMAVCPFWTKTQFFKRAVTKNEVVKKYVAMYNADDIVNRLWRDLKRSKDVSKYGFIARAQVGLCKIMPHSMVMRYWMFQQKL